MKLGISLKKKKKHTASLSIASSMSSCLPFFLDGPPLVEDKKNALAVAAGRCGGGRPRPPGTRHVEVLDPCIRHSNGIGLLI